MSTTRICSTIGTVVLCGGIVATSCGGSEKKSDSPKVPLVSMDDGEEYNSDDEDEMIPDEKLNEINTTFERKSSSVARCYPEAVEAGEADNDGRIKVTVGMVIQKSGIPNELKVIKTTRRSEVLESCVIQAIGRWQFTDLPQELPYTFTFVLQNL